MNNSLSQFGLKIKNVFSFKKERKGTVKEFIAKLSRGLMLPIAMLPIAGIFLGVGAAIVNNANGNSGLEIFGNFLKIPGDVIFGALPVLFAIAIAIAFTKDAGPAALSALIGFLVFSGLQSALIVGVNDKDTGALIGYNLLFYLPGSFGNADYGLDKSLFSSVLGINQLSTSVFGGFVVGFTTAFLYNKFKNIQLPAIIGFFNGVRFVPVVTFLTFFPITLIVLMVWPLIGTLFSIIGGAMGGQMFGCNSFIFGFIERALVPFGLHHAFYSPLWYSNVGGQLDLSANAVTSSGLQLSLNGTTVTTWLEIAKTAGYDPANGTIIAGDQVLWAFANSNLVGRTVKIMGNSSTHTITFSDLSTALVNGVQQSANGASGVNIGQYMQGKYPFMMFGLPAAAAAMIVAAPKENRKMATSIIASAGGTAMLTGITEPIEFTFLFLAPWLFWGVHAFFCALSFGLMNWIGLIAAASGNPGLAPHIGMTFSGGLIDWVIYGGIQIQFGSNAWWSLIIGLIYVPIYFFLFLILIKKFNIQTPGRGDNSKLFTKQDFLNKGNTNLTPERVLAINVIKAYGGLENIKNVDACITKLRIQVANQELVDGLKLTNELGAKGVIKPSKQSVYAIYGNEADRIKNEINDIIDAVENNPSLVKEYFESDLLSKDSTNQSAVSTPEKSSETIIVKSPIDGTIVKLEDVPDETFSGYLMGSGIAIKPSKTEMVSPIEGKIAVAYETGHAYIFESNGGTQVLVHIGIDSVNLKDENNKSISAFDVKISAEDKVKIGDQIAKFDLTKIEKYAKSQITPIIILDESLKGREVKLLKTEGTVKRGDPLIEVSPVKN